MFLLCELPRLGCTHVSHPSPATKRNAPLQSCSAFVEFKQDIETTNERGFLEGISHSDGPHFFITNDPVRGTNLVGKNRRDIVL